MTTATSPAETTRTAPVIDPYRVGRFYFHLGEFGAARGFLRAAALARPLQVERWVRWLIALAPPGVGRRVVGPRRRMWHALWEEALCMPGFSSARDCGIAEVAEYLKIGKEEALVLCAGAEQALADAWRDRAPATPEAITRFYQEENAYIANLVYERTRPFEFNGHHAAEALFFARSKGLKTCLDFGSGDGSCGLFYAHHGLGVGMADVAPHLLDFVAWRFRRRGFEGRFFLLPRDPLPPQSFDLVTSFDVFEHLARPEEALGTIHQTLKPGGFLIANIPFGATEDHPMHLPHDHAAFLAHARVLGFHVKPFTIPEFLLFRKASQGEGVAGERTAPKLHHPDMSVPHSSSRDVSTRDLLLL